MPEEFEVTLTGEAFQDLAAIHEYAAQSEGLDRASEFLSRLAEATAGLYRFPHRGSHPRELVELGLGQYRQLIWGRYRLIYRVEGERVMIYLIADGRRGIKTLLAQRLLGD